MSTPFTITLAMAIHEAGRASVAAGQTLAHAVQPSAVRPFVEWVDLPPKVIVGRCMTAARLLEFFDVTPRGEEPPCDRDDRLAEMLHYCERAAIDAGMVLVQLGRPWCDFSNLPEPAQEGRRRQAGYLVERYSFRYRQQVTALPTAAD